MMRKMLASMARMAAFLVLIQGGGVLAQPDEELTVSHGLSAFGELKYAADFTHLGYVNPDAPKGGALRMRPVIAARTFDSFNMYILNGDPADGAQYLFDTLMARAFDEPDAMYGLLAESAAYPADRSFVIFTLREEARFSSGAPVTAKDVAWSITTLREQGNPRFALPLKAVTGATVLNERQVRFEFSETAATRDLPALVARMPIFEKAHFDDRDFAKGSLEPPVGSGPYKIGDHTPGRTVTYERREDYWARDLPIMRGQFNFDQLIYEYFGDHDVAFEAFTSGAFDLNEVYVSKNWATKYDFDAIRKGWVKKELLADGRPSGTQGFFWNARRPQLSDPRVREALGLAFDFEWTNEKLFYGLYTRTDSFFENSDLQAEGAPSPAELALLEPLRDQIPAAAFDEAFRPPVTNGSGRNRGNLRRARKLLDEAGWKTGPDGVRVNEAGERLAIEFLDRNSSSFDRIVDPYIANLGKIGVEATLRQVDFPQYERRAEAFDFDVVTARFPLLATPGPELKGYLSSASASSDGSFNMSGVSSPAIDMLLDQIASAGSRDELRAAASALDRVYLANHYWTSHWYKASHAIAYWDRFGRPRDLGLEKPPFDRAIILTWWFDPEKSAALDAKRAE